MKRVAVRAGGAAENDIPELTALRILAALCVVVSHLHGLGIVSAEHVHRFLDGGRPAVSFFFVLSGFIMNHKYPHLHSGDRAATKRYAYSRIARLYPTLLLALCAALPTGIYWATTHASNQLLNFYAIKDHYYFWLIASAIAQILAFTGWMPVAAINQPWNAPAWSLSCEFFFYAAFPFLRPALQEQSSRKIVSALILAWVLQGGCIVAIQMFMPPNRAGFMVYQFPLTHFFEFMLGVSTGILASRFSGRQLNRLTIVTAMVTTLVLAILYFSKADMPAYYGLTPIFAVLIAGTVRSSGSVWLAPLRQGVVTALGHASYALYMIHLPILIAASALGIAIRLGWFWLPLLLLASLLVHYWYAEPVRRLILRRRYP